MVKSSGDLSETVLPSAQGWKLHLTTKEIQAYSNRQQINPYGKCWVREMVFLREEQKVPQLVIQLVLDHIPTGNIVLLSMLYLRI